MSVFSSKYTFVGLCLKSLRSSQYCHLKILRLQILKSILMCKMSSFTLVIKSILHGCSAHIKTLHCLCVVQKARLVLQSAMRTPNKLFHDHILLSLKDYLLLLLCVRMMYVQGLAHNCTRGGQRATLWNPFPSSTCRWILGTELMVSGLSSKCLHLLSGLTGPKLFFVRTFFFYP